MTVSIVIPVKNEQERIGATLQSLLLQETLPQEVIVVDNQSTDVTVEEVHALNAAYAEQGVALHVLDCPEGNQIEARQLGFDTATGDLLVSLDADSRLSKKWITRAITLFSERPELVVSGGPILYNQFWVAFFNFLLFIWNVTGSKAPFFIGSNGVFRKTAWEECGGLTGNRELMDRYNLQEPYDDLFLSRRMAARGKLQLFFRLWAYGELRIGGKRAPFWQLYRRWRNQPVETAQLLQGLAEMDNGE